MLWSRFAWVLLIIITAIPATHVHADTPDAALQPAVGLAQLDGVLSRADGTLTLATTAATPPHLLADFQRYGSLVSAAVSLDLPTTQLRLDYSALTPVGTLVRVDARGSSNGQHWLPWVVGVKPGAVVGFGQPVRHAQYRVILAGGAGIEPTVRDVRFATTSQVPNVAAASPAPFAVAPTFRVRATRMGMVGGRTANGYIIPPRGRFVSLPSWSVLSTRGRDEYQVRVSYRGHSTVVPVYDVGPYSERDDYWDLKRDGFPQLERGWPMDHAAYYEGYNGGRADKGFVRFPTAVDVGDGVWWDDLGIDGDQAEIEITFLWMGQDPQAGPPARDPAVGEQLVDELGGDFWHSTPLGASAMGCGMYRHAYWASATADPATAPVSRWQPALPSEAVYDVFVHVPSCPSKRAPLTQARYLVQHRDGAVELALNQQTQTGWVHLGRFPFTAGTGGFVQLAATGEAGIVWFDQAKWVRVP